MPFLRFSRDRRGYENTFLVHTVHRKGGPLTRILYWFRSPPDVKVGRAALDEEAIRGLESLHPELASAWGRILESRPPLPDEPGASDPWRERHPPSGSKTHGRPPAPPASSHSGRRVTHDVGRTAAHRAAPRGGGGPAEVPEHRPTAREALGAEDLARFRARHAETLARINQHVSDPAAADELRTLADALNPDTWVTADDVSRGIAGFNSIVDDLRRRMGLPRRGVRGGRKHRASKGAPDRPAADGDRSPRSS